ncbi:MAG: hypothetical protein IPO21_03880 [Bacteroidales bacterium]|nr:hypothetical protein [Bacteroidales bacterium]
MKPLHNLILLFVLTLQTAQLCYSQATRETAQLLTTPGTFEVINNTDEYWYKYIADSACTVTFSTDLPFLDDPSTFNIFIYKGIVKIIYGMIVMLIVTLGVRITAGLTSRKQVPLLIKETLYILR